VTSNAAALEHILSVILSKPFPPAGTSSNPPFHACLAKVGVSNALDLVSLEPSDYGIITLAVESSGPKDQILSLIQVKKINSIFSRFHQVSPSGVSRWLDLDYSSFQAWHSLPTPILQGASPASISLPSSAIYDFIKSVKCSISDYQVFKEDCLWHSWHRHLLTTARSHNVDNVLNLSYSPTDADLPLVTAAGFAQTHQGPAIVFMKQYAGYRKGHIIHSTAQIRAFGTQVHDSQWSQGGQQRLITSEGYHIPLSYRSRTWICVRLLTRNCSNFHTSPS
jgi:hypothetical protein